MWAEYIHHLVRLVLLRNIKCTPYVHTFDGDVDLAVQNQLLHDKDMLAAWPLTYLIFHSWSNLLY